MPRELQRDVYATWRALSRANARTDDTYVDKLRAYRAARDAALTAIA